MTASPAAVSSRSERGRLVSLKHCALMREPLAEPKHLEIRPLSRGERRRRSLRRGIARWQLSTSVSSRARVKVLLVGLSVEASDPLAARGAIRAFWSAYRDTFGKRAYFSWAELQHRGAVHYHALLVNPPWTLRRHARKWIGSHWPLARVQPAVDFRDDRWFREKSGAYVRKYASDKWTPRDENGAVRWGVDKSYQQQYELLPREIRTFENNRLEHQVAAVDAHLGGPDIVWLKPMAPFSERILHVWLIGRWKHWTPHIRACTLAQRKPPPRISTNEAAAFTEDRSGHITASSARS